ncbi:MAG: phosphoribosyl-AMP cyclohydrolase [Candidatus Aureabacteria bacterium]|nr:phosphoribosyl-AMP cyclohydrolase [Candidatus Auribacterota bacterium]
MKLTEEVKFDKNGLVPAIIQDFKTLEVLMVAYMNKESLETTLKTGKACFWSRSRQKLWIKGETSGHIQKVKEIFVDCDNDTLLIKAEQIGGACHTGYRTCFYRKLDKDDFIVVGKKFFDPGKIYKKT